MLSMWKRIMRRPNGISLRECDLVVGFFLGSWFLVLECKPLALKCIPHVFESCEDNVSQ